MNFSTTWRIVSVSLIAASAQAVCPTSDSFTGACTVGELGAELERLGCEVTNEDIKYSCKAAATAFGRITNNHYQFDKNYMDGGTSWNNGALDDESYVAVDQARITLVKNSVGSGSQILWPEYEALDGYLKIEATDETEAGNYGPSYMSNFNLTESCQLNTVMCCFTHDKDVNQEIPDNTEVCSHDLRDSRRSNHIQRGWADYDNNADTYCTGFAWSDDESATSNRYKGNSLFDISFLNTVENGYTRNVPNAPMCACLEKMPKVTASHCRKTSVSDETVNYSFSATGEFVVDSIVASVGFEDCGEDLKDYASNTFQRDISERVVGSAEGCDNARTALRNEKFWVPGTTDRYIEIDENEWKQIAGEGLRLWPILFAEQPYKRADLDFRSKLGSDSDFIVRRYCDSCAPSHRDIYYRRFTEVPPSPDFNLLDLFLNNWNDTNNVRGIDFNLYSSYDDAKNGYATRSETDTDPNAWKYCNFNYLNVGFPRDCGPSGYVGNQWNSFKRYGGAASHGYYVK